MTLHISAIDTQRIQQQLRVAYACPHGKKVIQAYIENSNKFARSDLFDMFERAQEMRADHVFIDLFIKLARPCYDLTDDQNGYVADLVLPWHIVDNFLVLRTDGQDGTELHDFVGNYSQDVYACSYNEDWVRSAWNEGRLRSDYEGSSAYPNPLSNFQLRYNKYDDYMTFMVKMRGYWPDDHGHKSMAKASNLTEAERAKIDAFDAAGYILGQYEQIERT